MTYQSTSTTGLGNELHGVYVGVVTDNQDPEDLARVRLTFPWRGADDESSWARIATPMAGGKMGTYFLPEVGDEVLVAFEEGNIHDPYVLGSLWSGDAQPPTDNADGNNDVRQITSKNGHEIVIDDGDGGFFDSGGILITTNDGNEVRLADSGEVTIADSNGNTIDLGSNGTSIDTDSSISLSGTDVTLSAKNKVSISGKQIETQSKTKTSIVSKGKLEVSAKGMLDIAAKGMATVQSKAIMTIKGSLIKLN